MSCTTEFNPKLMGTRIKVEVDGPVDFERAKELAVVEVTTNLDVPMLIAWHDSSTDRSSPEIECCDENLPGWLAYGRSHGADHPVQVGEHYFFMFREGSTD